MKGYVTPVPADYADLPQLRGRATVEMILKKPNGEQFDIEGALFKEAKMKMIIDGYTGKRTVPLKCGHLSNCSSKLLCSLHQQRR
jgi:hypothetical protein